VPASTSRQKGCWGCCASRAHGGHGCGALDYLDKTLLANPQLRDDLARLRLQQALALLRAHELAQAAACLDRIVITPASPERRPLELSRLHLAALNALGSHDAPSLAAALNGYAAFCAVGAHPTATWASSPRSS